MRMCTKCHAHLPVKLQGNTEETKKWMAEHAKRHHKSKYLKKHGWQGLFSER